jgi:hypothetical protein
MFPMTPDEEQRAREMARIQFEETYAATKSKVWAFQKKMLIGFGLLILLVVFSCMSKL